MYTHFKDYLDKYQTDSAVKELTRNPLLYPLAERACNASRCLPSSCQDLYQQLLDEALYSKLSADMWGIRIIIRSIISKFAFCLFEGNSFEGLNGIIKEFVERINLDIIHAMGGEEATGQIVRDSIFETGILSPCGCAPAFFPYLVATELNKFMRKALFEKKGDEVDLFLRTTIIDKLSDPLWHEPFRLFAGMISNYDFDYLLRAFLHPETKTKNDPERLKAMYILLENINQVKIENSLSSFFERQGIDEEWGGFVIKTLRAIDLPFLIDQEKASFQSFIDSGNVPESVIAEIRELLAWAEEEVTRIKAKWESS